MGFINVVKNSFSLLRRKPQIFFPKLILNIAWSIIWLTLATTLKKPASYSSGHYLMLGTVLLIATPINLWIFNSYVFMVRQFREKRFSMRRAFRKGLKKMPQSLGSMAITSTLSVLVSVPGLLLSLRGLTIGNSFMTYTGYFWTGAAVTSVFIGFYLVPASVISGDESFRNNFRDGLKASVDMRKETTILALVSLILLFSTLLLEGVLRNIGIAGYFGFRMVYGIVNVYILLLNPSLLMDYQRKKNPGQKLNGLDTKIDL